MSNEKQLDTSQIQKQSQSIETIGSLNVNDTQSQIADLKENYELDKKLSILKNSELSKLSSFDKFIEDLKDKKNKDKLDYIIKVIELNYIDDIKSFIDEDSIDYADIINDEESYVSFKEKIEEKIEENDTNKTVVEKEETTEKHKDTTNKQDKELIEEINNVIPNYLYIKSSLGNIPELNDILAKFNDADGELINYNDKKDIKKAKESKDKIITILKNKDIQNKIFEALKKEATETHNTEKLKKVALNFKELGVISEDRYNEIYNWADEIDKKKTPTTTTDTPELTPEYTARGDTLYKKTEETSFVIKDGKMICKSNESGLKLVDYNSLDEEGKALADKMKLDSEIKELKSDLGDNLEKKKILDNIKLNIGNKDMQSINIDDLNSISSIIYDLPDNMTSFKDSLTNILQTSITPSEKIEYLIKMLYANITGSTNHTEIDNKEIRDIIFSCNQKLTDSNNKTQESLKQKETALQELQKKFPNLDEKTIQDKIKSQENRMQDTVSFCDKFGLSSLGHISYIKRFIQEMINISKKEGDIQVTNDIGTGTEFMSPKYIPIFKKYLARIFGRQEADIFKNGNEGLKEYDGSTNDPDSKLNKNYLENLLKSNKVLKLSGELNTLKLQELIEEGEKVDGIDHI